MARVTKQDLEELSLYRYLMACVTTAVAAVPKPDQDETGIRVGFRGEGVDMVFQQLYQLSELRARDGEGIVRST